MFFEEDITQLRVTMELETTETAQIDVYSNPYGYERILLKDYVIPSQFPIDVGFSLSEVNAICSMEPDVE